MIELTNISKRYGNVQALDNLSLTVEKGRVMGLLGKNGAGKSTVMNILVGSLRQDAGSVRIDGFDIWRDPIAAKSAFGYLPENVPVYTEFTVREYLRFAAELNRIPKAELRETVDRAMSETGFTSLANRLIGAMSKGQKQRVAIAQAIFCTRAKIMILDEPTSGLDPSQIMQFRSMIRRMRGEYTVLLSSHILSDITAVCDDIAVIDSGKLITCGKIDEITEKFSSYTVLELTVDSNAEPFLDLLRLHPNVVYANIEGKSFNQKSKLVVKSDCDIRLDVFNMAVSSGAALLNMSAPESTLNNIFARITSGHAEET